MPTRDILFPMLSYPVMTASDSIEKAATLAAALGAHISGVAFEQDIHLPVGLYARPPEIGGILARNGAKARPMRATLLPPSTPSAPDAMRWAEAPCMTIP